MSQFPTISVADLVSSCYVDYGRYVNWMRAIPAIDGLKPSQRRVLLATRTEAANMTKTAGVVGEVIKTWHPHGSASIEPVVSDFVRRGLINGQGNHGAKLLEDLEEAAPRYTEVQHKKELEGLLFKLMEYAPHFDNEMNTREPEFLVTPIPIALLFGTSGIGVGVNTRIPAFTYESMLAAYRANNPQLLESAYGYKLIKDKSQLDKLWTEGTGRLTLKFEVDHRWSDDDQCMVSTITGSGALIKPRISNFDTLLEEDRIFIRNESKKNIKLTVGRTKGTRAVSDEKVFEMCNDISVHTRPYAIRVNVFGKVRTIGIKDWLDVSIGLFRSKFAEWQKDQVKDLEFKKKVAENIVPVAKLLFAEKTEAEIVETLGIEPEVVAGVFRKSIGTLRREDFTAEIAAMQKQIDDVNAMTADEIIDTGVGVL